MKTQRSTLEDKFLVAWNECGFQGSDICCEHRFHPTRKWRFDFAWPSVKVAVECQGYNGGHSSVVGMARDAEKFRKAAACGWTVLLVTSKCLSRDNVHDTIADVCEVISIASRRERSERKEQVRSQPETDVVCGSGE
jgi:very-short-patch-repair endonuclease